LLYGISVAKATNLLL